MQQHDQAENIDSPPESGQTSASTDSEEKQDDRRFLSEPEDEADTTPAPLPDNGFDWLALLVALCIAAFFAATARFNSQPSPSFIPAAVFSASGCGLLVTALRKVRGKGGAGLREAAIAGLGMALFQFAVTFTYPDVLMVVQTVPDYSRAFLLTWGLVALFSTLLSLAGAVIGQQIFTSLRLQNMGVATQHDVPAMQAPEEEENGEDKATHEVPTTLQPRHTLPYYAMTILLFGLLPMLAGFVFAAAYDFLMGALNINQISPALYPTLGLLSGLLPWRIAVPINLTGPNGSFIVFTLLWRVPDTVLGNPHLFDVQALEPLLFNATGLAFLLIALYRHVASDDTHKVAVPGKLFLGLEALLGLILVLAADLWLLRGLEGVLQLRNILSPLPILPVLTTGQFVLNLVTGPFFCLLVGLVVRRQYELWTMPRQETPAEEAESA